jgi:hypothetical protein
VFEFPTYAALADDAVVEGVAVLVVTVLFCSVVAGVAVFSVVVEALFIVVFAGVVVLSELVQPETATTPTIKNITKTIAIFLSIV